MNTYELDLKQLTNIFYLTDYDIVFIDELYTIPDIKEFEENINENMRNRATVDLIRKAIEEQWTFRIIEDEFIKHTDEYGHKEYFYSIHYELMTYSSYNPYEYSNLSYKYYRHNTTMKETELAVQCKLLEFYKTINSKYPGDFYKIKKDLKVYTSDGIPYKHWNEKEQIEEHYYMRGNDMLYILTLNYEVTKKHKNIVTLDKL